MIMENDLGAGWVAPAGAVNRAVGGYVLRTVNILRRK
jgi:hypothetical protein